MTDGIDWSLTTYEGNRRRQHEEFRALSFREKLLIVEDMGDIVARLQSRRDVDRMGHRRGAPQPTDLHGPGRSR